MNRAGNKQRPDQIAELKRELADGSWLTNARKRSQRRKSPWNLLLPLLGFPLMGVASFGLVWVAYQLRFLLLGHPDSLGAYMAGPMRPGTFLVLLPSMFAAVAPALIAANFLVYLIPPARRAMDVEDRPFPSLAYGPSQRALARIAGWLMLLWLAAAVLACAFK